MLYKVSACNINISFKKVKIFISKIRKLSINNILIYLNFLNNKISKILKKLFFSIIFNINNKNLSFKKLIIKKFYAGKGLCLKRVLLKAKGRSNFFYKHFSNIYLTVMFKNF